ncbi:MAG TPA: DNA-directed RNA polymerase subunit N [Candidatus Norongarragalinales archaeon]|nr:DNA-directed RNA polymerase subunit N [Candidatus Norongarragalinales archaeon]
MQIPIRCFTCGNPVSEWYEEFRRRTKPHEEGGQPEDAAVVLDDLGIARVCCRRMLLANVDLIDEILMYPRF